MLLLLKGAKRNMGQHLGMYVYQVYIPIHIGGLNASTYHYSVQPCQGPAYFNLP